uniref:Uncharacterized protein n=1 Tax=viral metagenome TaxID=1070528 RepID=A0A6H1ZQE0_9ZZZZ
MTSGIFEQAITMVKDVGFPIAAFMLMWYSHNSTLKKLTEEFRKFTEVVTFKQKRGK